MNPIRKNRQNYKILGPTPNQRGRPKKTDSTRLIELMEKSSAIIKYDTSHHELTDNQYLNRKS